MHTAWGRRSSPLPAQRPAHPPHPAEGAASCASFYQPRALLQSVLTRASPLRHNRLRMTARAFDSAVSHTGSPPPHPQGPRRGACLTLASPVLLAVGESRCVHRRNALKRRTIICSSTIRDQRVAMRGSASSPPLVATCDSTNLIVLCSGTGMRGPRATSEHLPGPPPMITAVWLPLTRRWREEARAASPVF